MKTPQQIKNEVEKEILEKWSLISTPDETLNKSKVNDLLKNAVRNAINQIITEYDKAMKEMIRGMMKKEVDDFDTNWNGVIEELLSKIGEEKQDE